MNIPESMTHCEDVLQGIYDLPLDFAKPPIIVDIGANVGAFAHWAFQRWPGCSVVCYEPMRDNYDKLLDVWEQNKANMLTFNAGVRSYNGKMTIYQGMNNCGECSVHPGLGETTGLSEEVRCIDAAEIPRCHILKIDTEGCELEILNRLWLSGRTNEFRAILLEWHSEADRLAIDQLLKDEYQLAGAHCSAPERGVAKYVHRRIVKRVEKKK